MSKETHLQPLLLYNASQIFFVISIFSPPGGLKSTDLLLCVLCVLCGSIYFNRRGHRGRRGLVQVPTRAVAETTLLAGSLEIR